MDLRVDSAPHVPDPPLKRILIVFDAHFVTKKEIKRA